MPSGIKGVFATSLDTMSGKAMEELDTLRREGNKTYKYVQFDATGGVAAAIPLVPGDIVFYINYINSRVMGDRSAAEGTIGALVAGQVQAEWGGGITAVDIRYGWIQIEGQSQIIPTDMDGSPSEGGAVASGGALIDKTLAEIIYTTGLGAKAPVGICTEKTAGIQTVLLMCPK